MVVFAVTQGSLVAAIDSVLETLTTLFARMESGLVVACSDVLFALEAQRACTFDTPGVTGIGVALPVAIGEHHGVYMTDAASRRVTSFFQKEPQAVLRKAGAVSSDGYVTVDSGIVCMDPSVVETLLRLCQVRTCVHVLLLSYLVVAVVLPWRGV